MQKASLGVTVCIGGLGKALVLSARPASAQSSSTLERVKVSTVERVSHGQVTVTENGLHPRTLGVPAFATPSLEPSGNSRLQGNVAGGMACSCDSDCGDGDPCTFDFCDNGTCRQNFIDALGRLCDNGDGLFCTNGQCDDSGQCLGDVGGDSCDMDEVCDDVEDECDGTECTLDSECDAEDDPDNCLDASCQDGRCIVDSTCVAGEVCDGSGTCTIAEGRCCANLNSCVPMSTLADCNGGLGPWAALADCDCPKYSSGFNDDDALDFFVRITTVDEDPCTGRFRVGDDYGTANDSYLQLSTFSFIGGPAAEGTGNGSLCFSFYDSATNPPTLATGPFCLIFDGTCNDANGDPDPLGPGCASDADCAGVGDGTCGTGTVARGNRGWVVTFNTGFEPTIPKDGFFTMEPNQGSAETAGWLSVNNAGQIGDNDPAVLLSNDGIVGPVLSPDFDDVLAFELIGVKIADPTGACCFGEGVCEDGTMFNTEWLCDAAGGNFSSGVTCLENPCDEATCCFTDGSCQVLDPGACTGAGGDVGIFGGTCDLNCCPQPPNQSDTCIGAVPVLLDTAASPNSNVVVRLSGDNSFPLGTNGTCSGSGNPCRTYQQDGEDCPPGETCNPTDECLVSTNDVGVWHAFTITSNANVEIGYCCQDPASGAAPGFRWIVIVDDCNECSTVFRDADATPIGCADGQPSDVYSQLTAGTYYYAVFGERYCQNSAGATDCVTDADCEAAGTGPCITQTGPYELQVTATDLPTQACCLSDVCIDTVDALECMALDGFPVTDTPLCQPVNPCTRGACCLGAGVCDDAAGTGITRTACELNPTGQYIGGARCADDPCPVCEIEGVENCQFDTGIYIVVNDRALWAPGAGNRWVDDFRASNAGALDRICWWPAFFNPGQGTECSAPGEPPEDMWNLRVYQDDSGLPGAEIGAEQMLNPDAKVSLGATSRVWQYSAPVSAPPVLQGGECYWVEITGEGEGDNGCTVYATLSDDGNHYVINDTDFSFGPEDVVTEVGTAPVSEAVDVAMCVSIGMDPGGCGEFTGACCTCGGECTEGQTVTACNAIEGFFFPGSACEPGLCPEANIPGDNCGINSVVLEHPGGDPANEIVVVFDNRCATTDGPVVPNNGCAATGSTPMVNDLWYEYTAPCCGTVSASMCPDIGGSADFDSQMTAYTDSSPTCACPIDDSSQIACGDSTCGVPSGPSSVEFEALQDNCYLVRIAGTPETGTGSMIVSVTCGECEVDIFPPLADDRFDVNGTIKACTTDADCQAGETGPDSQTVCRDSTGDGVANACYVARQRNLVIKQNPASAGASRAYRIALDTGVAGIAVLGFADAPIAKAVPPPGPTAYNQLLIVPIPHYMDWNTLPDYLNIADCEVSPGNSYVIQAIPEGADTAVEGNYSAPLNLSTPKDNGDVSGGGNPGDPPNGATGTLVDVFAMIKGFQNTNNEPKDWLDVSPATGSGVPNFLINLADAFDGILAFQQNPYGGSAPLDCP